MWQTLQRLWLGVALICISSAILLISDAPRSKRASIGQQDDPTAKRRVMRVAMFQMASQLVIDEGAAGVLQSLREAGYVDGGSLKLSRFNAEGDVATANAIAQEIVGGNYDLLITLTTGALQAVANANQKQKVRHVFGLVSDPVAAGVGIGAEPFDHPGHLVGIGTFPPVDQCLALAKKLNPHLTRVGMGWNPAEINSEVCTKAARATCSKLNIELLEVNVENTAAVKDAVGSLIDRHVDAIMIGGDVTMLAAVEVIAKTGRNARIPTFTCIPGNVTKGTLFDLGANYFEVGRAMGRVASRVLQGESIAEIPVEIAIPPKVCVNSTVLKDIDAAWSFSPDLLQSADLVIDETGPHEKPSLDTEKSAASVPSETRAPVGKRWNVRLLACVNSPDVEEAEHGLLDGLKKSGLEEGRDDVVKSATARGDIAALNGMVDASLSDDADLLLKISTPTLQACAQRAK